MSVNSYLTEVASEGYLSEWERDSINTSLGRLKNFLNSYFCGELEEHFKFGSSTRGTILPRCKDDNSDIDYMVVFRDNGFRPQTYLDRLKVFASRFYSRSEIYQDSPAIVLELNHIKFELVPAVLSPVWSAWSLYNRHYRIPGKGVFTDGWMETTPNDFNDELTRVNSLHCSLIKPLIRVMKYWNALHGYPFESFELEKRVVQYPFCASTMLKDYFYAFVASLNKWEFGVVWKQEKVQRLKQSVEEIKHFELVFPDRAEALLRNLLS